MAALTEEERAKLRTAHLPIQRSEHTPSRVKNMPKLHSPGSNKMVRKTSKRKSPRKSMNAIPRFNLGEYFLALLGLVMVMGLVGEWMMINGQWKFQQHPGPVAVTKNRNARAAALRFSARRPDQPELLLTVVTPRPKRHGRHFTLPDPAR